MVWIFAGSFVQSDDGLWLPRYCRAVLKTLVFGYQSMVLHWIFPCFLSSRSLYDLNCWPLDGKVCKSNMMAGFPAGYVRDSKIGTEWLNGPLYWIMFYLPESLPPQHHDCKDHLKRKQQQFFLGPFQSLVWMHLNAARMAVSVTWAALLAAASVVELQPILAAVSRQLQHSPHWSGQLWLKTGGLGRAGWMSTSELSLCSTQKGRLRSSANLLFAAKAPRWALMIWTGDGLDLKALCLMLCEITLFAIKRSNYTDSSTVPAWGSIVSKECVWISHESFLIQMLNQQ